MKTCGDCDSYITTRPRQGKDGVYRCKNCSRLRRNAAVLKRMNAKAAEKRALRKPKLCDVCKTPITDKRAGPGRDGLFRCTLCQKVRNREHMTAHMRKSLTGAKAEQYKATRNAAKSAWEKRNPEGRRARGLIKSVRKRLKKYEYDLERFQRPSTKELAAAIMALPSDCQSCGTEQDLTIEHIKPVVSHPELALEPSNLTTLCRPCNTRSYYVH